MVIPSQHRNDCSTVCIGQLGSDGMHMLPIGVCWEARLGKGRYLIDVLLRDGVVADGVAQMGDVIEVEITNLFSITG